MIQVYKIIFFAYTKILQTGEMLLKVREAMWTPASYTKSQSVTNRTSIATDSLAALGSIVPNVDRSWKVLSVALREPEATQGERLRSGTRFVEP